MSENCLGKMNPFMGLCTISKQCKLLAIMLQYVISCVIELILSIQQTPPMELALDILRQIYGYHNVSCFILIAIKHLIRVG